VPSHHRIRPASSGYQPGGAVLSPCVKDMLQSVAPSDV
jgi:hypothetical protein